MTNEETTEWNEKTGRTDKERKQKRIEEQERERRRRRQ